MRLAIVSLMGGVQWGGSEELWYSLADHALKQGDTVFISLYKWDELHEKVKALQSKGAVVYTRRRYNANAGFKERVSRFVKKRNSLLNKDYQSVVAFEPDAVFISQGDSFDLAIHHCPLYKLLQKNKIEYSFVCHSHSQFGFIPPPEIFPGAVEVFQNAHKVYFVSHRQWKITERRLATNIENGAFTWNPLNLKLPALPLKWPNEELVCMAIVASLGGTKGHDTLFEVLSGDQWQNRNWQLNVYGTGEGLPYLQALSRFYNIDDKVCFKGFEKNIELLWSENHLLLVPSAGEGLPISLVEAMACGRPAVVTDVGGNTELITEGENGFTAASPTTAAFSVALENAWRHKQNWSSFGFRGFKKVNKILDKAPHEKIYNELTNQLP